jgi:putative DNA primase/helicase
MFHTDTQVKAPNAPSKVQVAFQDSNTANFRTIAPQGNAITHDAIEQFRQAIATVGLTPPTEIIEDGAIHRFSSSGRPRDESGWYVFHSDGIAAGSFGCWRQGLTESWCSKSDLTMTEAERQAQRDRVKAMQVARDAEQAQRQQKAGADALRRWTAAAICTIHDYLTVKGVKAHSTKIEGCNLLIPMRDTSGKVHSLQIIAQDGTKMFMSGGRVKGCYFSIGKPAGRVIICEGFATGASIHEATGDAVAVAFNAGNLEAVAVALRTKYPSLKIVIAADDDLQTDGNPGLNKARAAALAVGGWLAVPVFKALA